MARKKRSEVSLTKKLHYLSEALTEMEDSYTKYRTDVIGIACQYSSHPKLKREDFKELVSLNLIALVNYCNNKRA